MPVIALDKLAKYFDEVKAVDGISFAIEQGEIFGFLGPNGAGKTTTIRCMMDFLRPTSGRIMILDNDACLNGVELKQNIGYLAGSVKLYDSWTGQQHIDFVRKLNSKPDNANELIQRLNFTPLIKTKYLSSGNRQKLGVILAFMFKPKILILDEPTNALDPLMQNIIYEIIREQTAKGSTVFMSSHNLAEVERVCSRVGIIRQGKIVTVESVNVLKEKQLYKVKVSFEDRLSQDEFSNLAGIEVIGSTDTELTVKVKGEIAPVLQILSQHKIKNLEIGRSSLEDIFLEYY
ncbi:MAG: ABC transporter ATP-binding protein [bacterium]|nr:ABC transporter ATP-binding protein [bacterium]